MRILRFALPATVVLIAAGLYAANYLNPLRMLKQLPIDPGKVTISGTRVTMAAPRLQGYTRDARAYDMTARSASQDLTKPDLLELEDIHAKVEMQDKAQVDLTAATGVYDRKIDQLTLNDRILMVSSAGYEARLSQAQIDVKSGRVTSQQPVDVKFLNGTLNANRLQLDDKGEMVRFEGGVTMTLMLDQGRNEKQGAQ